MKIVSGLIALFVTMPIWFFLLFRVLEAVNANELMWFLYWVYLPASLFVSVINKIIDEEIK
jgi:hypothetical protein